LVTVSLAKTMSMYPAKGWIRGDVAASTEILNQLNDLRRENADLLKQVSSLEKERASSASATPNIASGKNPVKVLGTSTTKYGPEPWERTTTWDQIFYLIGPLLLTPLHQGTVAYKLGER